jgi:hypothetical protein
LWSMSAIDKLALKMVDLMAIGDCVLCLYDFCY